MNETGKKAEQALVLNDLERHLLNDFQHGFPLSPTPYADLGEKLGVSEESVLHALEHLQSLGMISRVGAVFRPNRIGVSTLAAMSVPTDELEAVAQWVNHYPEVNHNYEREHAFNLWFVITAANQEHLEHVMRDIELNTGLSVMALPLVQDYHIDLGFPLQWGVGIQMDREGGIDV